MHEKKSIENMSFEEALSELETIVRKLDSGQETLEASISSYERASELKKFCEKKLEEARLKIEIVTKNSDGSISLLEKE